MRTSLLIPALTLLAGACASAGGPRVVNNPCEDPAYRALKAQPVDSLSEREYAELQEGDAACLQVQAVVAASSRAEPRRPQGRLDTDAYTQAMRNEEGSEIYVRNRSTVPIRVTILIVSSCVSIRDICGTQHPGIIINPGDARRVGRVRYQADAVNPSFQYSYRVEPANPEQP